jgi:carbon-monoxide dehydrogenase large subunit
LPSYRYEAAGVVSNKAPLSPYRGVGLTVSQTLRELLLDDAARALGIDRMVLRRRNMVDDGPWLTVLGEEYEAGSWRAAFERCLELIDYEGFVRRQADARAEGRLLGIGLSPFVEPAAIGSASKVGGLPGLSYDSARVTIDITGKIEVAVPTFSTGQGHHTTIAQMTADMFGIGPEDVRVLDGDTARTPYGMGTFGSRSAVFATGTVSTAGTIVRDKVKEVAAVLLEATPDDLELVDGSVGVTGVPASRIPLASIAQAARYAPHVRAALDDPTLTATAFFDPPAPTHSNGTIGAIVEVDGETGAVRIEAMVATEDCGTMLNPMIVEGQIRGGIAQGIGLALLERYTYDDSGQPQAMTFADYLIPRSGDVPRVLIDHLETPSPTSPGGVKGMAEGTATAAPAAIICAVLDALAPRGAGIESLPLTPERIAEALSAPAR